jgi:23S rRNA pseudouridine1911/1915/1917 synthase
MAGERRARLVVPAEAAGERLDVFVARQIDGLSRAQVQRLIRDGQVATDRGAPKPGLALRAGQVLDVVVPAPAPATPAAEALPLHVIYDDEDLVVIDKPAGIVVHPAAGHATGTIVNALLHHVRGLSGVGGAERPGIVHRLDRGTSGVLCVAKHDQAHRELARQFRDREVEKIYVALVWGTPRAGLTMDRAIGRDPRNRRRMSTRARRARTAQTTIERVEPLGGVSLVHVRIGTGRTHQIRVHLSEAGHPVAGDELYGGVRKRAPARFAALGRIGRPFLHAARLAFAHPRDGRPVAFDAPLPADLQAVVDGLRRSRPT